MFQDALQDTATFYTVSYDTSAKGQQKKIETVLYDSIPCRISMNSQALGLAPSPLASETPKDRFTLQVKNIYGEGVRGGIVVIDNTRYIIHKKHSVKGAKSTPEFYLYILEEE